jgi:hypothetical protein
VRRAGRIDGNQSAIVDGLRKAGISVSILSGVGVGIPDLLCGYRGRNILLEIKDPSKPKADRQLTEDQQKFFREWRGQKEKVETLREALDTIYGEAW